MSYETWPSPEEAYEKCQTWLYEVKNALDESSPTGTVDHEDARFLLQLERGTVLSERRQQIVAGLLDRREAFLEDNGADIIMEQYTLLKMLLDRSA